MSRFTTLISRKKALEILQERFVQASGDLQEHPPGGTRTPGARTLTIGMISAGKPGVALPEPSCPFIPRQARIRQYYPNSRDHSGFAGIIHQATTECQAVLVQDCPYTERESDTEGLHAPAGTMLFHGVAIHPGSDMMAADVNGIPVFFLPPGLFAESVICREFLIPLIISWGYPAPEETVVTAECADSFAGDIGQDDYLPVTVARIGGRLIAVPAGGKTEDARFQRGNGILHISEWKEGCAQETAGQVILYREASAIDRQILVAGIASVVVPEMTENLSKEGYQLTFRNAPPVMAAMRFAHRYCHGILLPGPVEEQETAVQALLGPVEELTMIHAGDEEIVLCFRSPPDAAHIAQIQAILPARIPDAGIFLPAGGDNPNPVFHPMPDADAVIRAISAGKGAIGICSGYRVQQTSLAVHPVVTRPVFFITRKTEEMTFLHRFFS